VEESLTKYRIPPKHLSLHPLTFLHPYRKRPDRSSCDLPCAFSVVSFRCISLEGSEQAFSHISDWHKAETRRTSQYRISLDESVTGNSQGSACLEADSRQY
jgi:hypothetical protein